MGPILSVHPRMVRYNYVMGAVALGSADCFPNYIVLPTVIRIAGKSSQ